MIGRPAARCLPSRLTGGGIERDHVRLTTVAVTIDDQQIPIERRRSAIAMLRFIAKVCRPQDLSGRADGGGPLRAEMHVNTIAIDNRCRRRATVFRVHVSGFVEMKDFDVDQLAPRRDVVGQRAQRCRDTAASLFRLDDSRQPYASVGDNRRGPSMAGNRRLPDDVGGFAPLERQTALGGMALTRRAAELRPVLRPCQDRCPGNQEEDQQLLHYPF